MQKKYWRGRGRLPNGVHSHKDEKILGYLAMMVVKHKVDPNKLFNCIVKAWNQQQAECNQIMVRCRKKTRDSANFLFTANGEVLAQFPIPIQVLQGKNELQNYLSMVHIKAPPDKEVRDLRTKDLKSGMKKVNLKGRVLEIPEPNKVYTRHGTEAYVTNALVGDETGTIRMNLWNQQINMVSEGDLVKIENGTVASFRGERQLRIGKHGRITVVEDD
jgi:replication factor A1